MSNVLSGFVKRQCVPVDRPPGFKEVPAAFKYDPELNNYVEVPRDKPQPLGGMTLRALRCAS